MEHPRFYSDLMTSPSVTSLITISTVSCLVVVTINGGSDGGPDRVYDDVDPRIASFLVFNGGGFGADGFYFDYRVKVGDEVVSEFDSIEYRFDGTKSTDQRCDAAAMTVTAGLKEDGNLIRLFSEPSPCLWNDCKSMMVRVPTGTTVMELLALFPCLHRRLTSSTQVSNGACHMNADGTGTGSNKKYYVVYKREDDANVDYEWCRNQCTGIEYRDTWDTTQCEIWISSVEGFEYKDRHFCLVKVNDKCADDSECQGEKVCHNGSCVEVSYLKNLGVCRKNSDGTGKGSNGNEYDLHNSQDVENQWCMDKCSKNKDCTGIEHRWHTKIKSVLDAPGSNCDKKVYSSTPAEKPVYVSYKEEDGVCRSNADGTGQGSKGNEYDLYLGLDYQS